MIERIIVPDNLREKLFFFLAPPISVAHIYLNTLGNVSDLWQNAFHFASFIILAGLVYPYSGKGSKSALVGCFDFGLVLIAGFTALFLIYQENAIYDRGVVMNSFESFMAIYLIFFAIVYAKRITGWVIPFLMIFSLSYVSWLGSYIGGVFSFSGLSFETVLFRNIYGDDALFGSIAGISSSFVFMFVLFGAFLMRSGTGDFIISISQAISGKMIGGPGFVALFSSALSGTISGSAIANTASTGIITIPIMKKHGYDPKFAAGIEAAASTGGQIMPPIMGAGAFVMSSFTQIPYTQIVLLSILPAIIYFATIGFYIRLEAKRLNLKIEIEDRTKTGVLLKEGGWAFLLPIILLIYMLVAGFSPTYSGGIATLSIIVCSWFTKRKMGFRAVWEGFSDGARNMILTAIVLCSVGIIVNTIAMTGIGNTFSLMIADWSQGNLLIALILIAVASLILGMGLPVTASYIILATLSAPILYQLILNQELIQRMVSDGVPESISSILSLIAPDQIANLPAKLTSEQATKILNLIPKELLFGIYENVFSVSKLTLILLTSHLIIFWLSQDSNVTPPVCLVAFTAAAIAKTSPIRTGFQAWKIAKGLYLVPFLMAYTPILSGNLTEKILYSFLALVCAYAFTACFQGYMHRHLNWVERGILFIAGVLILYPSVIVSNIIGTVVVIVFFIYQKLRETKEKNFLIL